MDTHEQALATTPDQAALLAELMGRYAPAIYRRCYALLKSDAAAADATQETFLAAYQALDRFRGQSYQPWLLRIARNACYDQLRRQQRRRQDSLDRLMAQPLAPLELPSTDGWSDPEEQVLDQEFSRELQQALAQLPAADRRLLILAGVRGWPYGAIAALMGGRTGTVKSRIFRARGKLRLILAQMQRPPSTSRARRGG